MNYLNRASAPLSASLWNTLDQEAVKVASELLTARRFLEVEGPYGVGLTTLEVGHDEHCRTPAEGEAAAIGSRAIAVPMLRKLFKLSIRRIVGHEEMAQPLGLTPVGDAAEAVARREEDLIYHGQPNFNLPGLLNVPGSHKVDASSWEDLEATLQAVLKAVNVLDDSRCPGPYALVLAPQLYNGLFRRYSGTDMLQVEHLARLCKKGVFKAPIESGVLVDASRVGRLVIGQDLMAGYVSQDGLYCDMSLSESIALVVDEPRAICVLK